jgi:VanZ family protein
MHNYFIKPKHPKPHVGFLRLIGWLMVLAVIVMSLIQLPATELPVANSDKWLHLLTYGWLSYWFFHTYTKQKVFIVIGFVLLGLGLETLQQFTPYRHFEWLDMLMNSTGVLVAFAVFWGLKIRIKWLMVG